MYFHRVRSLIAFALVLTACSGGDRAKSPAARTAAAARSLRGPQALMLRIPRDGGSPARVTSYPAVDSVVWSGSEPTPSPDHFLAFDREAGAMALVDDEGAPFWVDFRVGSVVTPKAGAVRGLVSVDGSAIYGVRSDGAVARFTPSGDWEYEPPLPARAVFPYFNGALLVLVGRGENARIYRIRPPETARLDSLLLPNAVDGTGAPLGDRVFVQIGQRELTGVHGRTLASGATIRAAGPIRAVAATPSGDRFFVATEGARSLDIIGSFQDRITGTIELPGEARDIRVDPFGRYLLVRPADGDSVWIVRVGTDRVVGTVRSAWSGDIPFVAPDGAVAVREGNDVVFVDPTSMKEVRRAENGTSDFWQPFVWVGFRQPARRDTAFALSPDADSTALDSLAADTTMAVPQPGAPAAGGYTLSFALVLDEARAKEIASGISAEGRAARVVTLVIGNSTAYRVVLGPFATREEAERVGQATGAAYYIFAGSP